jgi:pimeloyl-ACP methyl ester carboxylesterase
LHEAADVLRRLFGPQFPKLSDDDWVAFARRTFKDTGTRILPDYDVKLRKILETVDPERPLAALWNEFDALARVPVMVIRGGNSDILSTETVAAMQAHHPMMEAVEVPDQGHAPLLSEPMVIGRIATFVRSCDERLR